MNDFEVKREFARRYEKAVARWLMRRGWFVLPTYDFSGIADDKAPKLMGWQGGLILPDLLACKDGRSRWCEVKFKSHADWTFKTRRLETGIQLRHWRHYLRVRKASGLSVWIVWAHEKEAEMRGADCGSLCAMEPRTYEGGKMGRGGMIFFPWDRLTFLASLSEVMVDKQTEAA